MLLLVAFAPLCAGATPHVLVWADQLDIAKLMPYAGGSCANGILDALTQAYLTRDVDGTLEPEVAERVPTAINGGISSHGQTITIRLRPSLR